MASRAVARRQDVTPSEGTVREATGGASPSGSVADTAKQVASFIPTEVITLYTAALAITTNNATTVSGGLVTAFVSLLIATPVVVWVLYATNCKSQGKSIPVKPKVWPLQEMAISSLAFVIWVGMLPATPFRHFTWYTAPLGGFLGLIFTVAIGLIAPLLPGTIKTD